MLFGKHLEVNFSRSPNTIPGADTHEYTKSNLNRFNKNAVKNYRYCCSPTEIIHMSTLPQDIIAEEIVSMESSSTAKSSRRMGKGKPLFSLSPKRRQPRP